MRSVLVFALFASLLSCTGFSVSEPGFASNEVSFRGSTQLRLGRLNVNIPASAMPSDLAGTRCIAEVSESGKSGDHGIRLNDTVWDLKIFCDQETIRELFDMIRICIEPADGNEVGKLVFQEEGDGFAGLPRVIAMEGYVCGLAGHLSLFTLGLAD